MKFKLSLLLLMVVGTASASHNVSRYFPFLERPEEYVTKGKSFIYPGFFITNASTGLRTASGKSGIPELWGRYNLKNLIEGIVAATGESYNPFANELAYSDWDKKDLKFRAEGKIKSRGVFLSAEKNLFKGFSAGVSIPVMAVNTSIRFSIDKENSDSDINSATDSELDMFDRVRRSVHTKLGLKGDDYSDTGFGDLDVHLGWRTYFDHVLKMRGIDLNIRGGFVAPTGKMQEWDYPSSVSFMGDGRWTVYGDVVSEFELKQNWKLGLMGGVMYQFKNTEKRRIPYFSEPPIFSALCGDVEIKPGITFKVSPYFTLENMADGLHLQGRYTFLRHSPDEWRDKRPDKSVLSYLDQTMQHSDCVRSSRRSLSRWKFNYLTAEVIYDSAEAMKHWIFEPKLYAILDYAFGGHGASKTHQFTIGIEFHI